MNSKSILTLMLTVNLVSCGSVSSDATENLRTSGLSDAEDPQPSQSPPATEVTGEAWAVSGIVDVGLSQVEIYTFQEKTKGDLLASLSTEDDGTFEIIIPDKSDTGNVSALLGIAMQNGVVASRALAKIETLLLLSATTIGLEFSVATSLAVAMVEFERRHIDELELALEEAAEIVELAKGTNDLAGVAQLDESGLKQILKKYSNENAIDDRHLPKNSAPSLSFTDFDGDGGEIEGDLVVTKSTDESDITHYVVYWGSSATTKHSATPIASLPVTGSNVTHSFAADTAIPSGATHLLVFTSNADGEMATGASLGILDLGVPEISAQSISFTDTDLDGGELEGDVTITIATDESDITHYVVYWGTSATTKHSATPIVSLAVTGSNVTHSFAADTAIPSGATHLLVFTSNADGEMATGASLGILDLGVPENTAQSLSFTDTDLDGDELEGDVTITIATDESDITHYVLYWGSNGTTKHSATPIVSLPVTGSNVTHSFAADTAIPSGATHLLVFTSNADGEMAVGINLEFSDAAQLAPFDFTFDDQNVSMIVCTGQRSFVSTFSTRRDANIRIQATKNAEPAVIFVESATAVSYSSVPPYNSIVHTVDNLNFISPASSTISIRNIAAEHDTFNLQLSFCSDDVGLNYNYTVELYDLDLEAVIDTFEVYGFVDD